MCYNKVPIYGFEVVMKFKKEELFTIPNILTYIRLIAMPFFVWMMAEYAVNKEALKYLWAGIGIFVFAEITDVCDGYIARHFNQVSDIGKILDPIADKLLQCIAMLMLCICGNLHWIFAVVIIVKEIYMGASSKYYMRASKRQVEQKSNKVGKAGAAIYFIGIALAFFAGLHKVVYYIDTAILTIGSLLAIIAAIQYTVIYNGQLKKIRESGILETLDRYGNTLPSVSEKATADGEEKSDDNDGMKDENNNDASQDV